MLEGDESARAARLLAEIGAGDLRVTVEPAQPGVDYRALGGLPPVLAYGVARRQAKRLKLPGTPAAVAIFDRHQEALAVALQIVREIERSFPALAGRGGVTPPDA